MAASDESSAPRNQNERRLTGAFPIHVQPENESVGLLQIIF
jgi:hypothetical protein